MVVWLARFVLWLVRCGLYCALGRCIRGANEAVCKIMQRSNIKRLTYSCSCTPSFPAKQTKH